VQGGLKGEFVAKVKFNTEPFEVICEDAKFTIE
jgi:hypothetical protein